MLLPFGNIGVLVPTAAVALGSCRLESHRQLLSTTMTSTQRRTTTITTRTPTTPATTTTTTTTTTIPTTTKLKMNRNSCQEQASANYLGLCAEDEA
jgi:hypothetical protein